MDSILSLAAQNLISPIILFFVLGFAAAFARSDLSVPEAVAKGMSLYLLFAIGFKGGASVAAHGIDQTLIFSILAGVILSFVLPFIAFALLRVMTGLTAIDAAAVAAHYGSISIVTFVAASSVLQTAGLMSEGYMVAVAAAMEAPAILAALWLVARADAKADQGGLLFCSSDPSLLAGSQAKRAWIKSPLSSYPPSKVCCAFSFWIWALWRGAACGMRGIC